MDNEAIVQTARRGRPPGTGSYTPEIGEIICAGIASGMALTEVCRAHPELPSISTISFWVNAESAAPGFPLAYARARIAQAVVLESEIITISDDGTNDYMDRQTASGDTVRVLDSENVNRSRLRVDSRKWLLSKLHPDKYGDRVAVEHSGTVGLSVAEILRQREERIINVAPELPPGETK